MRRLFTICLLALSATALLVTAPAASGAKKKASKPSITRVTPMRISVGNALTIRGRHFKAKRRSNTVIFRASNGRTAFAKPRRASRRKLVVVVPEAVSRLLRVANNRQRPTRLKLRVLAGRFSKYTPRRLSPVVTGVGEGDGGSGGGGGGGTVQICQDDADHDNDLLGNDLEKQIGTDPCLEDTDGDQMSDGWEYWSAKDLNIKALPYPGKRPFTNALDPSDGGAGAFSAIDFDGDGLTSKEEYRLWRFTGSAVDWSQETAPGPSSVLAYSDGTKHSRPAGAAAVPKLAPTDPSWRDSERDADGDGLGNWLESANGPGHNDWWKGFWNQEAYQIEPWPKQIDTCPPQEPGHFDRRPFAELDLADPDVDGDGVLDGADDQDNDDYSNSSELYEVVVDLDGDGNSVCGFGWIPTVDIEGASWIVNAFNPCAPDRNSRTCADFKPFE